MIKLRRLFPFLCLLAFCFALPGCGSGGESDEDKIVKVIETSATSDDPADCRELSTQAFLEQTEWSEGAEAFTDCEDEAGDLIGELDSLEVSNIEVKGSKATADVAFQGATYDGQMLSIALVEQSGDWKLNEVVGFADLDQEKLAQSIARWLQSGDTPQDVAVRNCIGEVFGELSRPQAEDAVFSSDPKPMLAIYKSCSQTR